MSDGAVLGPTPLLPPDLRYLFLVRAAPPELNRVREDAALLIVTAEGIPGDPDPGFMVPDARLITITDDSATFRLYWHEYVACAIRPADLARHHDEELPSLLVEREHSPYLDFVRKTSEVPTHGPPLRHYELFCLHHRIDVVAAAAPRIHVDARFGSRWDPNR